MVSVAIAGASGYAGGELIRIIHAHPHFELVCVAAGSNAGSTVAEVHPQFAGVPAIASMVFTEAIAATLGAADLVFLALPHGQSAALAADLPESVRIVDLGADFRLSDESQWNTYYGGSYAGKWTYGLPEIKGNREKISSSTRVANPGCYATANALALAPLIAHGLVDPSDIVIVAASGTSGAGRSAKVNLLGSEVMGSMSPYKIGGTHQHTPEIEETLQGLTEKKVALNFTPMLAPMSRGILATVTVPSEHSESALRDAFASWYADEPFITVLPEGQMPTTAAVYGSNSVQLQVAMDNHTGRAVVVITIDNLVKGAAGQAVQNANLMHSFTETAGLSQIGVAP